MPTLPLSLLGRRGPCHLVMEGLSWAGLVDGRVPGAEKGEKGGGRAVTVKARHARWRSVHPARLYPLCGLHASSAR